MINGYGFMDHRDSIMDDGYSFTNNGRNFTIH